MTKLARRRVACVLLSTFFAAATLFAVATRDASATTWPLCDGGVFNGGASYSSNGKNQHPEIAYMFWESAINPVFSNGTSDISRTQWIGFMLSLVNNGQYFSEMSQYGTYGGATGSIAPPRVAPYATIYEGPAPGTGHNVGTGTFTQSDIANIINAGISNGSLPLPQANDNSIYMVIVPDFAELNICGSGPAACCNWNANYGGTAYKATTCGGTAGAAHEILEAIGGYELSGNAGQVADPCDCDVEVQNNWSVASYYSARINKCVVPESWGDLYVNPTGTSGGGWSSPSGSFPMRQGYAGSGGVVATDAVENGSAGNSVHFFNGSTWSQIGEGGSQYAAGGGIIAGIAMDPAYGIYFYDTASEVWSSIGGPGGGPPTSVTVNSSGIILATDVNANPWYYNPFSSPGWVHISGPGDQFIAWADRALALNPAHNEVFSWGGPGTGFTAVGSVSSTQIISSPDSPSYGFTSPGENVLWNYGHMAGTGRQFVATDIYSQTPNFGLLSGINVDACYGTECTSESPIFTSGYGGWLMGGTSLYVTGCTSGVAPCVNE